MGLQEKLDAYKEAFLAQVPAEAQAVMRRATEELRNFGILDTVRKVGQVAPEFCLPDACGNAVALQALLPQGPVVIGFYRGLW